MVRSHNTPCPLSRRIHATVAFGFTSNRRCVTMVFGETIEGGPNDNVNRRQPMPWWAHPDVPIILAALPIVLGVVVGLLLPFIQWLRP